MHAKLVFVCLSIISADVMAADANNPSSSAISSAQTTKMVVARHIIAPTVAETRATRMPDGSLALSCNVRPNPKASALSQQTRTPRIDSNQQR
jgi:hypothetical protein